MMKTKQYRNKHVSGKTYLKSVGSGFETGFMLGGTPVFVGNFIHAKEAHLWFNLLNREIRGFSHKYSVGENFPKTWYLHFVRNHLYKSYYAFLDRTFARYNKDFSKACSRDIKKYRQIRKNWNAHKTTPFLKVA